MRFTAWIMVLVVIHLSKSDFTLHIAHVNDLWYQLDEIAENYGPCQPVPTSSTNTATETTAQSKIPITTSSDVPTSTTVSSTVSPTSTLTTETATAVTTSPTHTLTTETATTGTTMPTFTLTTETATTETTSQATDSELPVTTAEDSTSELLSTPLTTIAEPTNGVNYTTMSLPETSASPTHFYVKSYTTDGCFGGAERHKAKLTELQNAAAVQGAYFLNVNTGNMIGEPDWLSVLGPEPAANIANELGYHAMGLGHRDFLHGVPVLAEYLKELKANNIPVVCSNLDISAEPLLKDLIQPYVNLSFTLGEKSVQVGIVGFFAKEDAYTADFGQAKIVNSGLTSAVNSLKRQGVNTIIALGNAKMDQVENIVSKVSDIDIVVSGGSNVFLYNGNIPSTDTANGSYPEIVNKKLYVVQVPHRGKYLGHFNVTFDDSGNVKSLSETNNPILLDDKVELSNLTITVASWSAWVQGNVSEPLGATLTPFFGTTSNECWKKECSAGNLLTDAILNSFTAKPWKENMAAVFWPALAFAVHNPSNGTIYFEDIISLLPHNYRLNTGKMPGKVIRQFLEKSAEKTTDGRFLQTAGARITYDMSKPVNNRIKSIFLRNPASPTASLEELKDEVSYLIGIPSTLTNAGIHFLSGVNFSDTGLTEQEILRDYIKKLHIVNVGTEGRIQTAVVMPSCDTDVTGTVFLTIFLTLLFSGVIYLCYLYVWPKYRERRGSLMNLIR